MRFTTTATGIILGLFWELGFSCAAASWARGGFGSRGGSDEYLGKDKS